MPIKIKRLIQMWDLIENAYDAMSGTGRFYYDHMFWRHSDLYDLIRDKKEAAFYTWKILMRGGKIDPFGKLMTSRLWHCW